jgi:hypothetical protein
MLFIAPTVGWPATFMHKLYLYKSIPSPLSKTERAHCTEPNIAVARRFDMRLPDKLDASGTTTGRR